MEDHKENKDINRDGYLIVNISFVFLFLLLDFLSYAIAGLGKEKYILRISARGVFGLQLLYNSVYFLMAPKPSFITAEAKPKHRILSGVSLLITGLMMVIAALLGVGMEGDPVLKWWE